MLCKNQEFYQEVGCLRPEISVIVPVYKVADYIHRCIDSILSQTFHDFELILLDFCVIMRQI